MSDVEPNEATEIEDDEELTEFEEGFIEAILYRERVPFGKATPEEFERALDELDRYVSEQRPDLIDE